MAKQGKLGIMTQLLDRFRLLSRLGMTFNGARDLYAVFGYRRLLIMEDFIYKYARQDIAKRIVDAPAKATWSNPPKINFDGATGEKKFLKIWTDLTRKHKLWATIGKADRLAGLANFSLLLLGFSDNNDLSKAVTPDPNNKLLYIQAYSQLYAHIIAVDTDTSSERFGMPVMYRIRARDPLFGVLTTTAQTGFNIMQLDVHWTRVIHIAEDTTDNGIVGTPRLQAVFNRLDDLEKVVGGSSETFWLTANRGMQVDIDKEAELSPDDANALSDEIDEYQHQLRRVIRTRGVKINNLGSDVPDPANSFKVLISTIAASTGIPQQILMGAEQGHLASDQDRANWADRIKERREAFAEPTVVIPLIQRLQYAMILPEIDLNGIVFEWPDTFQMTPLENAQMMAQKARAAANLSKQFNGQPLLSMSEARTVLGFSAELPPTVTEVPVVAPGTSDTADPADPTDPPAANAN